MEVLNLPPGEMAAVHLLAQMSRDWQPVDEEDFEAAEHDALMRLAIVGIVELKIEITATMRASRHGLKLTCRASGNFTDRSPLDELDIAAGTSGRTFIPEWAALDGATYQSSRIVAARWTALGTQTVCGCPAMFSKVAALVYPPGGGWPFAEPVVVVESHEIFDIPSINPVSAADNLADILPRVEDDLKLRELCVRLMADGKKPAKEKQGIVAICRELCNGDKSRGEALRKRWKRATDNP